MNQKTLKQLHQINVEILDDIVSCCKKYNLHYYLFAGTLLGAVRHKGFIPWDDDIDLEMPRTDLKSFCQLFDRELSDKYILDCIESDERCPRFFIKVRKKNTLIVTPAYVTYGLKQGGIGIDVFPVDSVSVTGFKLIKLAKHIQYQKDACNTQLFRILPRNIVSLAYFLLKRRNKYLKNYNDTLDLMESGNLNNATHYVNWASPYSWKKHYFKISDYEPVIELEFEGKKYSCPRNPSKILSQIYGDDYMQLPPKEQQRTHNPLRLSFDLNGPDEDLTNS